MGKESLVSPTKNVFGNKYIYYSLIIFNTSRDAQIYIVTFPGESVMDDVSFQLTIKAGFNTQLYNTDSMRYPDVLITEHFKRS